MPGLYVGLEYTQTLDGDQWHEAEATGRITYNAAANGSFEVPIDYLRTQFPNMFFRIKASTSIIGEWEPLYSEIPQFVTHDYIDLDKITYITKFRSGSGHDYSDDYESCRNMKHYFQPNVADWSSVNIYSPVDGTIIDLEDSNGIQVTIQSSAYPAYKFIIFHVDILPHITKGYTVSAGEQIGNHINNSTNSDIAVRIFTIDGSELKKQLVSFFDVMTDTLFASYQARGISSRTDLIITAAQRDADPLHCSGESFYLEEGEEHHPDGGYGSIANKVHLSAP